MNPQVQKLFVDKFGFNDGMRIYMVVLPNIKKDFDEVLNKALVGIKVKEEYKFDDRKGSIILAGTRLSDGTKKLLEITVDGTTINLEQ